MSDIIARIVNDTPVTVKILADAGIVVRDEAYGATWNGDTTHSPSRNAVYDELVNVYADITNRYTKAEIDVALDVTNKVVKAECMFHAYLSADQENIVDSTATVVALDSEAFDVGSDFDTGNNKFIAPVTGYYEIHAQIKYKNIVANEMYYGMVTKDFGGVGETELLRGRQVAGGVAGGLIITTSGLIYLTAGEEIKLIAYVNAGVDTVDIASSQSKTFLMGRLVATA